MGYGQDSEVHRLLDEESQGEKGAVFPMSQEVRIVNTTTTRLYGLLIVLGFSIILNAILILRSTNVTYTVDLLRSLKAMSDTNQGSNPALERTAYGE